MMKIRMADIERIERESGRARVRVLRMRIDSDSARRQADRARTVARRQARYVKGVTL